MLDNLSNHDRTKWDFFFEMGAVELLNTIAFYKDKQAWEHEIIKEQQKRARK